MFCNNLCIFSMKFTDVYVYMLFCSILYINNNVIKRKNLFIMGSIYWPYPPVKTVYIEIPFTYGDILDALFINVPFRVQRVENNKSRIISDSPDFKKNIENYVKSIGYSNYISINDYYVDLSYSTGNYVYELFLNEAGIEKFNEICTILQLQGKLSKKYRTKYV